MSDELFFQHNPDILSKKKDGWKSLKIDNKEFKFSGKQLSETPDFVKKNYRGNFFEAFSYEN